MRKRAYGVETEFGTRLKFANKGSPRTFLTDSCPEALYSAMSGFFAEQYGRSINAFGKNGARYYQDVGHHPEYATPECTTPHELVCHQKAGNLLVTRWCDRANEALPETEQFLMTVDNVERTPPRPQPNDINSLLTKANSYTTWGQHESVTAYLGTGKRTKSLNYFYHRLALFLATRSVTITGTGQLYTTTNGKLRYLISQRADVMLGAVLPGTTTDRGVVNTRDEPHGSPNDARRNMKRIHIIVSDTLQSEKVIWLRTATLGLVLEMIERGELDKVAMPLVDYREALVIANRDHTLKRKVWQLDGNSVSSLEAQRWYFSQAESFFGSWNDTFIETVLSEWDRYLTGLEEDRSSLTHEVEWIMKRQVIESYAEKHFGTRNVESITDKEKQTVLIQLDMQWHTLGELSVFSHLEKKGFAKRITTDKEIEMATKTPPQDTRAVIRGMVAEFGMNAPKKVAVSIDWDKVSVERNQQSKKRKIYIPLSLFQTKTPKELRIAIEKNKK